MIDEILLDGVMWIGQTSSFYSVSDILFLIVQCP